eukprot:scaffold136778_cov58-Attheya_sp.AAC.1
MENTHPTMQTANAPNPNPNLLSRKLNYPDAVEYSSSERSDRQRKKERKICMTLLIFEGLNDTEGNNGGCAGIGGGLFARDFDMNGTCRTLVHDGLSKVNGICHELNVCGIQPHSRAQRQHGTHIGIFGIGTGRLPRRTLKQHHRNSSTIVRLHQHVQVDHVGKRLSIFGIHSSSLPGRGRFGLSDSDRIRDCCGSIIGRITQQG